MIGYDIVKPRYIASLRCGNNQNGNASEPKNLQFQNHCSRWPQTSYKLDRRYGGHLSFAHAINGYVAPAMLPDLKICCTKCILRLCFIAETG